MTTGIDFTPMLSQIAMGGVVLAVMSIAAGLAVVFVAKTGAGRVLAMLYGKLENQKQNQLFEKRFQREQKNQDYRQWKAAKTFVGPRRPGSRY